MSTTSSGGPARHIAFVLRCCGSAIGAYLLAGACGLPHPVWAAMSGVIVSQGNLDETRNATLMRIAGTLIGIAVAVAVALLLAPSGAPTEAQMTLAVALCASAVFHHPHLRVCMWTCPVVFLTADAHTPILMVGLYRAAEVVIGGAVGASLHALADRLIAGLSGTRRA